MAKMWMMRQARLQREAEYLEEEDDEEGCQPCEKDPVAELLRAHALSPLGKTTRAALPVTNLLLVPPPPDPGVDPGHGRPPGPCRAILEAMRKSSGPWCQNEAWLAAAKLDAKEQRLHAKQKRERDELDAIHAQEQGRIDEAREALIPLEKSYDTIVIHRAPHPDTVAAAKNSAHVFSYVTESAQLVWFLPGLEVSRGPVAMKVAPDTRSLSVEFIVNDRGRMTCTNVLHVRQRFYMFMAQHGQAMAHRDVATFFNLG
jgi:hypothetical protein